MPMPTSYCITADLKKAHQLPTFKNTGINIDLARAPNDVCSLLPNLTLLNKNIQKRWCWL